MTSKREKEIRASCCSESCPGCEEKVELLAEVDSLREKVKILERTVEQSEIIRQQNEANNCKFWLKGR